MDLGKMLFSAEGRIRRRDYWLVSLAMGLAIGFIVGIAAVLTRAGEVGPDGNPQLSPIFMLVYFAVLIVGMWIGVCLQVKRWHDRDKSWPWIFIGLIPVIGGFWVLIECGFLDGTQGSNSFGPSPKGLGNDTVAKAFE